MSLNAKHDEGRQKNVRIKGNWDLICQEESVATVVVTHWKAAQMLGTYWPARCELVHTVASVY